MTVSGAVGATLAVGGLAVAAYLRVRRGEDHLSRSLERYAQWLDRHIGFLLLDVASTTIIRAQLGSALALVVVGTLLGSTWLWGGVAFVAFLPAMALTRRRRRRVVALERQLETWLLLLANALKVSASVGEAIASTAPLAPNPFGDEVYLVVKELRLGAPLDRALEAAANRIGSRTISGAFAAIIIARRTGGNLGATLESASAALRETARIDGVLHTKTAEGRGQVLVLAATPFVLCSAIAWLDPTWFGPMVASAAGVGLLIGCGVTWCMATIWAHRIVRVDL